MNNQPPAISRTAMAMSPGNSQTDIVVVEESAFVSMSSTAEKSNRRKRKRRNISMALDACTTILKSLDTKVARKTVKALAERDYKWIVENESVDPMKYSNPDLFKRDWLAQNLLSKFEAFTLEGLDKSAVAFQKFKESETKCKQTNDRLSSYIGGPSVDVSYVGLLESARLKIQCLLGDFDWNVCALDMQFSGGASTNLPRTEGHPYFKFGRKADVTPLCFPLAVAAVQSSPLWRSWLTDQFGDDESSWFNIVSGSKMTTVPKSAKTDRVIAIEPTMNMFVQKGIGSVIRKALLSVGINLRDQSVNQRLAYEGSLNDTLSTIDLKAASDSISIELVRWLMPPDWFEAMNLCRSQLSTGDYSTVFHKFSSMGNGFTFELESLIFWALSDSCVDLLPKEERICSVYGDDIIVPRKVSELCIKVYAFVGFETNKDKTFCAGPFRESCGKHYFNGTDVTPFYVKKPLTFEYRKYQICNKLRKWAGPSGFADARYLPVYDTLCMSFWDGKPFRVPASLGDSGLQSTLSESEVRRSRNGLITFQGIKTEVTSPGPINGSAALLALYNKAFVLPESSLCKLEPAFAGDSQNRGHPWRLAHRNNLISHMREKVRDGDLMGTIVHHHIVAPRTKLVKYQTLLWSDAPTWCT